MTPTSENTNRILRQLLLVGIISGATVPVSLFAVLVGIGHFFLFPAPSCPSGLLLNYRDVRGARYYCESMMPRLESYRGTNGVYLAVADSLMPPDRPVPRPLQGKQFYRRVGADYEFSFLDPSPIWGGHTYFSSIVRSRGKWERWN